MMEIITRAQAEARGLKRYFTGEACKHGHIAERRTRGGVCVECKRAKDRRRRHRKNPENIWHAKNREKIAANRAKRNARYSEKARADQMLLKVLKEELGLT